MPCRGMRSDLPCPQAFCRRPQRGLRVRSSYSCPANKEKLSKSLSTFGISLLLRGLLLQSSKCMHAWYVPGAAAMACARERYLQQNQGHAARPYVPRLWIWSQLGSLLHLLPRFAELLGQLSEAVRCLAPGFPAPCQVFWLLGWGRDCIANPGPGWPTSGLFCRLLGSCTGGRCTGNPEGDVYVQEGFGSTTGDR